MNKTKIALICLFISTFTQTNAADPAGNNEKIKVVSALETALKNKDLELLKACVANDFSVSTLSMPIALNLVANLWDHIPQVDSIRFVEGLKTVDNQNGSTAKFTFYISGQQPQNSDIVFDQGHKIRYIDLFDQIYGMNRYKPSKLRAVIPFEYVEDAIVVTLKLNESKKQLRFLFDSGADGMAIKKEMGESIGLTTSHEQNTSVVGTDRSVNISSGNTVHLDTLALPDQNIALFEEMGNYDGIIGLNLAKHFIMKVDFDKSQISLYDLGAYTPSPDEAVIPVSLPDGLVRIPAELDLLGKGSIKGDFYLDTGAGFHVVAFSPFVRKNRLLLSGFKYDSQSSMFSLGHATQVYHGKATNFSFGGLHFMEMPIALQASSGGNNWDVGAAGSIGILLLNNYNFTINLVEKEIYMESR